MGVRLDVTRARVVAAVAGLALALTSGLVAFCGLPVKQALVFERQAILNGDWWRLLTAHVVHLNAYHAVLNVAALGVLAGLHAWRPLPAICFVSVTLVTAMGTGLGLLVVNPEVGYYVGLSGWLHGLAVMVAAGHWRWDRRFSVLLLAGLVAKLLMEGFYGANPSTESAIGARVVTEAHLYGALSATLGLGIARLLPNQPH